MSTRPNPFYRLENKVSEKLSNFPGHYCSLVSGLRLEPGSVSLTKKQKTS